MNLNPYSYCLLRYYQDAVSGEFANIGVVLWSPELMFLDYRFCSSHKRLSDFFVGFEPKEFQSVLKQVSSGFDRLIRNLADTLKQFDEEDPRHARDLATKVIPHDDGALRWSQSRGGVTADPRAELDRIYDEVILRHHPQVAGGLKTE